MNSVTYGEIRAANEAITTTDIKGKEYAEVNQRIKAFRMVWPEGTIATEMLFNENGLCIIQARVYDDENHLLGVGHAYEKESSSFINETSYIENCETSAVGRALGMCGFGIDTSVCSAEELENAKLNQEAQKPINKSQVKAIVALAERKGSDLSDICSHFGVGKLEEMTAEEYGKCLNILNKKEDANA